MAPHAALAEIGVEYELVRIERDEAQTDPAYLALKPLGVRQQGRSRVWWDDNGWWLGVVYFKPSGYARESNLELHIRWLWKMQSRHSLGDSVSSTISIGSDAWYAVYESDEQFALLIKQQAALAADHVAPLREG